MPFFKTINSEHYYLQKMRTAGEITLEKEAVKHKTPKHQPAHSFHVPEPRPKFIVLNGKRMVMKNHRAAMSQILEEPKKPEPKPKQTYHKLKHESVRDIHYSRKDRKRRMQKSTAYALLQLVYASVLLILSLTRSDEASCSPASGLGLR